uniref:Uncharacterized protein n=1 Tax=Tetradesmus obliquus TaxID=3088 RepID=A0A383WLH2_TETOB|eukprot:jgi/Sobl393_1/10841/SZX77974.1
MPAERMGAAYLACGSGCRCKPVHLEFSKTANTGIAATEVSLHPRCLVSVTIQVNTTTGGDEFAVTGVAVVPFSTAAPVSRLGQLNFNASRAEGDQLPFRWP